MILVDTSVLINFFRGRETSGTKYLENLINEEKPFLRFNSLLCAQPAGQQRKENVFNL